MTMNSSGPISLGGATAGQSINLENGLSATAQVSLNDTAVRNLAGVASGAITMPTNFYGKSNRAAVSYTFSANTANASLNLSSLGGYSAGKTDFTITVGSGIYLYSTSTGGYGLSLSGATTGDTVTVVNNGYIMGQGGNGGNSDASGAATAGGPALNIASIGVSSCTINNTNASAYIGGGGGGGGLSGIGGGGGGAGGGTGGKEGNFSTAGGSGGGIGSSGTDGGSNSYNCCGTMVYQGAGGGGGRIFPGTGGAGGTTASDNGIKGKGGGSGGGGGGFASGGVQGGGAGGSASAAGSSGSVVYGGGGGGGWGASGGEGGPASGIYVRFGGAGGKAVNTGGKSVTWTSGNTTRVYGAVS